MDSNLDFSGGQDELFPDMPKVSQNKSEADLLVDDILALRDKGVNTRMVSDFLGCPLATLRGWVIRRYLPPDWMAKKLRDELRFYPV